VLWTAGENPPGRPLVSAGAATLISEDDEGALTFNLDLARSNVQRMPAWPILMSNVLRRARATSEGFARPYAALGEELSLVMRSGGRYALDGPKGQSPLLGVGAMALPPPSEPGRYVLLRDGKELDAVWVQAIDARESNLTSRASGVRAATRGEAASAPTQLHRRPLWPLAVMLVLLLIDFWVTNRVSDFPRLSKGSLDSREKSGARGERT
jgi:hypothetical protein